MKSQNFEFLRPDWKELATLAAFAEHHVGFDPSSTAVKLRTFAEQAVEYVYYKLGLAKPFQFNLNDLLIGAGFLQAVANACVTNWPHYGTSVLFESFRRDTATLLIPWVQAAGPTGLPPGSF